ncbi:replication initiation protein [Pontibacter sp. E15-1]|uniref:replication initiation protein n=1 Tax=Pontibacter sp. E15-1 TaxID=2919918 RepID=UPI001F4FAFA6|nr:replication initiation protein [Pontibacter sp. E15-1]MCJ8166003.1 replication initiation protein [Pontibacter sp. E15-1]
MKASITSQSPPYHAFAHSDFGMDTLQTKVFTHLLEQATHYDQGMPLRIGLEEVLGTNPNEQHYTLLEEALHDLAGKRLTKPGPNRSSMGYYPLFEYLTFSQAEGGYLEALFSPHAREELQELTSAFSLKEIASLVMLRHSHTQRLFWFLRASVAARKVEVSVEELKEVVLGVRKYRQRDAEYERYYDFKTRVVDQAIKTIRDRGLLEIRYREHRHKRVVVKLVLTVNYCRPPSPAQTAPAQLILFPSVAQ